MHLIIDGFGNDPKVMQDERFIYELLDKYPARIGMTKISQPFVLTYKGPKPEDWGVSGFVFIAESHISVHTFAERCYVNIDVFSCKDFDAESAIEFFREQFKLVRFSTRLLDRDWDRAELSAVGDVSTPGMRSDS